MFSRIPLLLLGLAVLIPATVASVSAQQASSLTVREAARLAVAQNPNVRVARDEVIAAQSRIGIARSARYPEITASGRYIHTTALGSFSTPPLGPGLPPATVTIGSGDNITGAIEARLALYTGGRRSSQIGRAEALYDVAVGRLGTTELQTAFLAQQAFYSVLLGNSLIASAERNLAAARQQLEAATARFDAGTAARFDVLRAQTSVSEAEQDLTQARNQAELASVALNRILGVPLTQTNTVDVPALAPFPAQDVTSLVNTALSQRPELLSARAQVVASEEAVRIARADRKPQVGISANYQVVSNEDPGQGSGFTFTAIASQEIFDGGRISAAVREARSLQDAAQANLEETSRGVEQDVRQAYLSLDNARQALATAQTRVTQATEAYDVAQVRYEAGVGTATELADALAALTSARTSLDQANFSYNIAYAQLQRSLGTADF